eukprot:TRINITY_DN9193_c0_g3_i3.p1 TRINITY_DN9193_c0_g3~~TRINITY_DN9193_c0_g3_i3.p1  ORF type:complete len:116 (+),score=1.99 TRINITY_DN9193_c0_g3_i3:159-506(+)
MRDEGYQRRTQYAGSCNPGVRPRLPLSPPSSPPPPLYHHHYTTTSTKPKTYYVSQHLNKNSGLSQCRYVIKLHVECPSLYRPRNQTSTPQHSKTETITSQLRYAKRETMLKYNAN